MPKKDDKIESRRTFLKSAATIATAGAVGAVSGCASQRQTATPVTASSPDTMIDHVAPKLKTVRFGVIGTGQRGSSLLRLVLNIGDAEVVAVCDTDPVSLENAHKQLAAAGKSDATTYTGNDYAYRDLLDRDDIDAVLIATPWRWHAPMSIDAMNSGKHAFVEVPMATTLDDMWQMVEVSERTRMNCMMMENVCYGRDEMMVLNLVQQGVLGELTHGEGAYIHDLRWQMKETERKTGSWRTHYHTRERGNIYPTHGLGPIAQYMNINRGDRFDYMTSTSSPALGRAAYARREFPAGHERNSLNYTMGDMNNTVVQTALGRSILVQYDTTTARPYSRLNLVQGTNGAFAGFPNRIALEIVPDEIRDEYAADYKARLEVWRNSGESGDKPKKHSFHQWDLGMDKWRRHFDHPFWKKMHETATKAGGHGGMDYVMLWRLVQCLRDGIPLDQNCYDGAAWSSLFPLSHESVTQRSKSVDIPDFTRGAWKSAQPLNIQ